MKPRPFLDCGSIVTGSSFFGRERELAVLYDRLLVAEYPGNVSIVGLARIGKSSLCAEFTARTTGEMMSRARVPINFPFATSSSRDEMFSGLIRATMRSLNRLDWEVGVAEDIATSQRDRPSEGFSLQQLCLEFFRELRASGISVVLILDEFDYAGSLFSGDVAAFQTLRTLGSDPAYGVGLVTCSRRRLPTIEASARAVSDFHNVFREVRLGMFATDELAPLRTEFEMLSPGASDVVWADCLSFVGRHPYLLGILGDGLARNAAGYSTNSEFSIATPDVRDEVLQYHSDLLQYLKTEAPALYDGLVGWIVGSTDRAWMVSDGQEAIRYGLLEDGDGANPPYSRSFELHVQAESRKVDLPGLLRQCELRLRELIVSSLSAKWGPAWQDGEHPTKSLGAILSEARERRSREERSLGYASSVDLIDFCYVSELFEIIIGLWSLFQPLVMGSRAQWSARAMDVSRCRNLVQHYRPVPAELERLANAACRETLDAIDSWNAQV